VVTDSRSSDLATGDTFTWHPTYAGRPVDQVRRDLAEEIARDQRAYELALEGAEHSEHASLSSVMEIEKRWSVYSFDWADIDPRALADRIVAFELERDRQRELFPYADYRGQQSSQHHGRSAMSDGQRRRIANIGAVAILALIAIIVFVIVLTLI
jgi:hypothetical protein